MKKNSLQEVPITYNKSLFEQKRVTIPEQEQASHITKARLSSIILKELNDELQKLNRKTTQYEFDVFPDDIVDNKFSKDIIEILQYKIKGLTPIYSTQHRNYMFYPNEQITYEKIAVILTDILIKTGENRDKCIPLNKKSSGNSYKLHSSTSEAIEAMIACNIMEKNIKDPNFLHGPVQEEKVIQYIYAVKDRIRNLPRAVSKVITTGKKKDKSYNVSKQTKQSADKRKKANNINKTQTKNEGGL